jgi:hypothetical protein
MKKTLEAERYISPGDRDLFHITDKVDQAVERILEYRRRVGAPQKVPAAFE